MSEAKDDALRSAYTELAKSERAGDYERAIKACNRILKRNSTDELAFRCKIVCLIQLSKFEDALQLLHSSPPSLTRGLPFERAYCNYRLNRTDEAFAALGQVDDDADFRCRELYAQLLYRQERFDECGKVYRSLLRESDDDFEQERRANFLAVEAQLAAPAPEAQPSHLTYEQMYNEACRLAATGQLGRALEVLDECEDMCRTSLAEDGAADDEIDEETAIIHVQSAYCWQRLGDADKAFAIYADVLKKRPPDAVVIAVASNNSVACRHELNLFDARKKLKTCQGAAVEAKLIGSQRRVVRFNVALLLLHSNQYEPCRRAIGELRSAFGMSEEAALLEASLLLRQKDAQKAQQLIADYLAERPHAVALKLAMAQLQLSAGNLSGAVVSLRSLDPLRYSPAVVSLLVALNLAADDSGGAIADLTAALDRCQTTPSDRLGVFLDHGASLFYRQTEFEKAANCLERLQRLKPEDSRVLARLIQVYSQYDAQKAKKLSEVVAERGDQLMETAATLNVDALEASSDLILFGERYQMKKEAKQTPKLNNPDSTVKLRKRKRKPRLPQNYEPNVPPDPERWLAKYERSTFKRRKDRRAKDREIGRGPQGAVSAAAAALDASAAAVADTTPESPKPAAAPGPRLQRPAQSKAKKKKKPGGAKGGW